MDFFVKFWGTRGSIPTPGYRTQVYGGNTSCVEIRIGDILIICDGGSGLRELGLDLMTRGLEKIVGHMFFSHTHWDHIQGFPFFVPAYIVENTFYVYGSSAGDTRSFELLSGQMQSDYFPVNFSELSAHILPRYLQDNSADINGIEIHSMEMNHPGGAIAYSFESEGFKVVYACDNELDTILENKGVCLSNSEVARIIPKRFVDFARNADLLIGDGQYTDEEYTSKIGWGHSRATTLVDLAVQAGVKRLAVSHHDPLQSDESVSKKIKACRNRAIELQSDLIVFGAREGMELRIE
ncbi:MAG: MBL fold metallo-hydrolase [Deltaproteobacteria bacterium]|nr:MBL fold metallo-hydrolase [Deltaproteobacteria bacterium]MBW1873450.1 MBL fold metallo-hydrolase [Deltaproteobacteria bacterium]